MIHLYFEKCSGSTHTLLSGTNVPYLCSSPAFIGLWKVCVNDFPNSHYFCLFKYPSTYIHCSMYIVHCTCIWKHSWHSIIVYIYFIDIFNICDLICDSLWFVSYWSVNLNITESFDWKKHLIFCTFYKKKSFKFYISFLNSWKFFH